MKPSKKIAVVLAGALAVGGAAALVAPSAQAFPTAPLALACDVVGISTSAAAWNTNQTLTINGADGSSGIQVPVGATLNISQVYAAGPNNGGPASTGRTRSVFEVATAATGGTVIGTVTSGWSADAAVPGGGQFPGATLTGSLTAPTAGTYFVRVRNTEFQGWLGAAGPLPSGVLAATVNCNAWASTWATGVNTPTTNPVPYAGTQFQSLGALFGVTSISNQLVTNYARANNTLVISGSDWPASVASGGFTATVGGAAATNTLSSDGSGNLTGSITVPPGATTGLGSVVITTGALSNSQPITILGLASVTISPASSSPAASYVIVVTGSNFNPLATTSYIACGNNTAGAPFFCTGVNPPGFGSVTGVQNYSGTSNAASGTGTISGSITVTGTGGYTVSGPAADLKGALRVQAAQGSGPSATSASQVFNIFADRCIAQASNTTGAPGCATTQNVSVSVLQGRLTQRAYVADYTLPAPGGLAVPANGTGVIDGTGITTPIEGTSNVNSSATQINLGTLTTPFITTNVFGSLNPVTVSDNRGGTFGWSLTAQITDPDGPSLGSLAAGFNGTLGNTIGPDKLFATPSCAAATAANAWDYDASGQTAIVGFDPSLNAPINTGVQGPGAANQQFGQVTAVTLCTKNNDTNAQTDTTGGVYQVDSALRLSVPAFQAADKYAAVMTVTLV